MNTHALFLTVMLAGCQAAAPEPEEKPFAFETFESTLIRPVVHDAQTGDPVQGALVAVAATDHRGRPVILGRARTLGDGEAKIRLVLSPVMSETRVLALHRDYEDARSFELGDRVHEGSLPFAVPMVRR